MSKGTPDAKRRTSLATRAARASERLEALEGPEAARRMKAGKKPCGNLPQGIGKTRDVVGAAVAMGERLEAMEGPEAARRKAQAAGQPRGKKKVSGGNLPPETRAKTRDVVGAAVGMSGKSYEKAPKP